MSMPQQFRKFAIPVVAAAVLALNGAPMLVRRSSRRPRNLSTAKKRRIIRNALKSRTDGGPGPLPAIPTGRSIAARTVFPVYDEYRPPRQNR